AGTSESPRAARTQLSPTHWTPELDRRSYPSHCSEPRRTRPDLPLSPPRPDPPLHLPHRDTSCLRQSFGHEIAQVAGFHPLLL
ncbi:unnamed protein product, partial [Gulo gulo]